VHYAIECYTNAIKLYPDFEEAYFNRAIAYEDLADSKLEDLPDDAGSIVSVNETPPAGRWGSSHGRTEIHGGQHQPLTAIVAGSMLYGSRSLRSCSV